MFPIQRLLHPTDLSENSRAAFVVASEWARQFQAELHVLHIVGDLPDLEPYLKGPVNEAASWETMLRQRAKEALNAWPLPKEADGVKIVRALASGAPADTIAKYAQDHACDLIILGTHGRTGLKHVLIGSVAENVVRLAPCPVLVVRPTGPDSATV